MKRKDFLLKTGVACIGVGLLPSMSCHRSSQKTHIQHATFKLPDLGFSYNALEPSIDARTMEIHHSKHHAAYVKNLNSALEQHPLKGKSLEMICREVTKKEKDIIIFNNAGGHYNHSLFWDILKPGGSSRPKGALAKHIETDLDGFDNFSKLFTQAAAVFGSGWAWLSLNEKGKLFVSSTQNQKNPLMDKFVANSGVPILGIDVWEHAYYLQYQNKRIDYIKNFMSLINWDIVAEKYRKA